MSLESRQRGLDHRFFHLVRWELRRVRGRGRAVLWIILCFLGIGSVAALWWAATLPESPPLSSYAGDIFPAAIALLIATPLRDTVADLGQMSFGYALFRYTAYALIALCKLILPAIAAGSVAEDRQAGRMQDFQMMPIPPAALYLAKVVAAALLFVGASVLLFVLFVPVAFTEYVPLDQVGRLLFEIIGQILLIACVAVTCSTLFTSPWAARVAAYSLLWVVLPVAWFVFLMRADVVPELFRREVLERTLRKEPFMFSTFCALQALFTGLICLGAFFVGTHGLRLYGTSRRVGSKHGYTRY